MDNNWRRRRRRWRRWWWLCVVGSFLLEHTPPAPTTPSTKGKRLGQHACIGRVAQGQRGGDTRVCWECLKIGRESALGVFEKVSGRFRGHTQTNTRGRGL